ncbi:MAG TPA: cytochrome B6, partial [Candidatus Dormibacteraeota bacterium]|nr:cytochrome B6 [Candidatus Dormibacteraeota bacterium]
MKQVQTQEEYYSGVRMVPYDLVKELVLALAGVGIVALVAAAALTSPDVPPITIASWAQSDPVDFMTTATEELSGSTTSAGYGNPYNTNGDGQSWGPIAPQKWFGTRIPIDSADSFVIQPLQRAATNNSDLAAALNAWTQASSDQQGKWTDAYSKALAQATVSNGAVTVPDGDYGPLPVMITNLLTLAQAGTLDGLLQVNGRFYQTDYTPSLLFIGDGGYLASLAQQWNLTGSQWGMMNETGSYPGQTWLWLYTVWYQVFPFNNDTGFLGINTSNADL